MSSQISEIDNNNDRNSEHLNWLDFKQLSSKIPGQRGKHKINIFSRKSHGNQNTPYQAWQQVKAWKEAEIDCVSMLLRANLWRPSFCTRERDGFKATADNLLCLRRRVMGEVARRDYGKKWLSQAILRVIETWLKRRNMRIVWEEFRRLEVTLEMGVRWQVAIKWKIPEFLLLQKNS